MYKMCYDELYTKGNFMPIHCHTCTCTKTIKNRQYGPDPKSVSIKIGNFIEEIFINHPLYRLRYSILSRCYNAKASEYNSYQGKGIKVCDEWRNNPVSFYEWCLNNNWKKGLSLDRIDPNKDYEPSNCQFLTPSDNLKKSRKQNPKPRNAKLTEEQIIEIRKKLDLGIPCSKIAKDYGVTKSTIQAIKSGQNWKKV